jgi:endonuclease/exonuclease/phosphatase family metal-dependent hydrolase
MANLRVATWNIAGGRREATSAVDLAAVLAAMQALDADLLAIQKVDRQLARSDRTDQPRSIAQALGADRAWSYAPALTGDDFQALSGADPGGPAYGTLLVSRLPLEEVEQLRFPPAGGGEQRTAVLATIRVGGRAVTVAAAHLSNKQGHNVRQLRQLQGVLATRPAAAAAWRPEPVVDGAAAGFPAGWPGAGRGDTFPNSRPNRQLDHVLRNDPGGVLRPRSARVIAAAVSDHRALVVDLHVAAP